MVVLLHISRARNTGCTTGHIDMCDGPCKGVIRCLRTRHATCNDAVRTAGEEWCSALILALTPKGLGGSDMRGRECVQHTLSATTPRTQCAVCSDAARTTSEGERRALTDGTRPSCNEVVRTTREDSATVRAECEREKEGERKPPGAWMTTNAEHWASSAETGRFGDECARSLLGVQPRSGGVVVTWPQ